MAFLTIRNYSQCMRLITQLYTQCNLGLLLLDDLGDGSPPKRSSRSPGMDGGIDGGSMDGGGGRPPDTLEKD